MWSGQFSCVVPDAPHDVSLLMCEENKKITFFVMQDKIPTEAVRALRVPVGRVPTERVSTKLVN